MSNGWYKRRRGIFEHLESGKIGLIDLAVHDVLCLKMNAVIGSDCSIPPGVCFSSAVAIHQLCAKKEVSERTIRRSLEHLEKIGWIKRWISRGEKGNYPILICRGSVHDLSAVEYRVNGLETTDWRNPVFIPAAEPPGTVRDLSGYREERSEKERKPRAAKPAAPADPRFKPFVDFAFKTFHVQHGQKPTWRKKDFANLKALLKENQNLRPEELARRWNNYLTSTEAFTVKQGGSLAYFCAHFDSFMAGPVLKAGPKSGRPSPRNELSASGRKKIEDYGVVQ
jgi:hypothetical protein